MFFQIGYGKCQNKCVSDANQSRSNRLPSLTLQLVLSSRRIGLSIYLLEEGCNPVAAYAVGANIRLPYQDCVELSDLTGDKIVAIAQHERLTEMTAFAGVG